jgi:Ca-activated chloride channel family protein
MKAVLAFGGLALLVLAGGSRLCAQSPAPPQERTRPAPPATGVATFKVDVNLVLVEVGVHDEHGHAVGDLKQENFQVFEDGKEQQIRVFSHEELPLAVALVVDNSSSVAAAIDELRRGVLDTLALLKPRDQMALFSFTETPELEEGLTGNYAALAEDLWSLRPGGGTNINDAVYDAAVYLGGAAGDRRRAIILVSDNEPSEEGSHGLGQVVRAALDSGAPVYSIKVGYLQHTRRFFLTHSEAPLHDVEKICRESGGTVLDLARGISVTGAMKTILAWLQQGYTLGYASTNGRQDGSYRTIQVRVTEHGKPLPKNYTLFSKQGYYAPVAP